MNYGDVVLGVECALPRNIGMVCRPGRAGHARQFMTWLFAAFARRT